ncbi:MAG: hypothetical protein HY657_03685 [Acidobacteria bacterium]|nr:hypothetical protein [Acidobacteriota bacterium]
MARIDDIIAAVTQELRRCAADVDRRANVRSVTISIKLVPGTGRPRAVICEVESETRFLPPAGRTS